MTTTMSQTAFVTGGAGFLGRRLIRCLVARNMTVRCLVRGSSDLAPLFAELSEKQQAQVQLVRGDVADRALLDEELPQTDIVYHLAAALGGSPSTMFLNTVIPTRTLLEAAALADVQRFVLVSSLGVYGTQHVRNWGKLDETTPVDPHPELRDPYTFSKIRQEAIAWEARERWGLPLVVVRPGVIYGPGRSLLTSRVGLSLGPLLVRMGGSQQLPYTYVENCASAIALAGVTPGIDGQIFNVVDDDLPNGKRILRTIRKSGQRVRSVWVPRLAIGPLSSIYERYANWSEGQLPAVITHYKSQAIWKPVRYSNEKAKHSLNWSPAISTEDALSKTVAG
ncbi:NAD-dependent epimerase/dehydratase family protein [Planctomicrobium piriforme]|uniref:Nucleoside-diphosphate-sugar epimerase n=1 Tax=Planctomicrobium piriforme TaxID=1576369 RepID=A0A1I3CBJ8_9PLAN|nr:NAD(P)-dependent oxidoreductase [Planctomicrobium piriforme]SFH71686.1 Nucleoside-diphosphate-sugar epimerase [Planctomicrobium piriforme]